MHVRVWFFPDFLFTFFFLVFTGMLFEISFVLFFGFNFLLNLCCFVWWEEYLVFWRRISIFSRAAAIHLCFLQKNKNFQCHQFLFLCALIASRANTYPHKNTNLYVSLYVLSHIHVLCWPMHFFTLHNTSHSMTLQYCN